MDKRILRNIFKFCIICTMIFVSAGARNIYVEAEKLNASSIEEMQEMLEETSDSASEDEAYMTT